MKTEAAFSSMRTFRLAAFVAAGLILFFTGVSINDALTGGSFIANNAGDFREFYCAGEAVLQHADPYRVEPLRTCTHRVANISPAWLVVPAPLPGYALALFAALAKLPFHVAKLLWEGVLVASVFVAAAVLALLTRRRALLTLLVLIPTDGFLNLQYGGPPPLVIAALCVGALMLERGDIIGPAVCVGIAMIEPHLGLPALLALFLAMPRARIWLTGVATALAIASLLTIGLGANIEYIRSVLPLQALAEVVANDQYSFTHLLASFGATPSFAIGAGSASYALMVTVGVVLAIRLSRQRRLAYLLLAPPGAVALGGSYIHDVQLVVAIPLALLLAADLRAIRPWALAALILLLAPATSHKLAAYPATALAAFAATLVLGWEIARGRSRLQRLMVLGAGAIVAGIVAIWLWFPRHDGQTPVVALHSPAISAPAISPDDYAPSVWGAYLRGNEESSRFSVRLLVEKVPSWAGLIILICCVIQAARLTELRPRPSKFHGQR